MARVQVARVAPLSRAVREAAELPVALVSAVYERLRDYVGRDFDGASYHTERMLVRDGALRHAVTAVFFVDTDGTLNLCSVHAAVGPSE